MKIFKKIYYSLQYHYMFATQKRDKNIEADNRAGLISFRPREISHIELPKNIWLYWDGEIPELVSRCIQVIKDKNPAFKVTVLNAENLEQFCDTQYCNIQGIALQHKTDLVRLNLLYKFGGIWLDASTILNRDLNWIEALMHEYQAELFSYYRKNNTTVLEYPVIENWLLASVKGNIFIKQWLDELLKANQMGAKNYIQDLKNNEKNAQELFQHIGNIEYLFAYVACQKVMREDQPNLVVLDCDENALMYQVKDRWVKEKILIDLAVNFRPVSEPYLIKLARKERNYLYKYYNQRKYLQGSFLDF
ncbi:hypothetical protein B9T31_14075 [Acinetobacter sp. ANC 4558]|uniref:glycosyltransferase family 32 protein n=1 Tax=Acinetobacter sp. ANC 4558 TaxID=1977876 RepID=UPI000A3584CC|nr:capsular polysaccharide synthesis protein [Acinetobacter sp. ANC 4558]OTG83213.1 hypothetical protein B9T31_14075 [Acinetobacter sp. ANC 4558]